MDRLIRMYDAAKADDLMLCPLRGVAYQADMTKLIAYGTDYFQHYKSLDKTPVANALNEGRCAMLARHLPSAASVIDIGAGSGIFVRMARAAGFTASGFDINQTTVQVLREWGYYSENFEVFDAFTFWDSVEHIPEPEKVFKKIKRDAIVCVAIPIMADVEPATIRASKHYKPGEHLYYFTEQGFIDWMAHWGFRLLEKSTHEIDAGRESIGAFAFKKDLPDYHDHVLAYREMHSTRFYGSSATELHLETVAEVVAAVKPNSILDYGCGRSDLASHFWLDGKRQIVKYDPAIPTFKRLPNGMFDLVLCCDVMEHIPFNSVERVVDEVRSKGYKAFFTISMKLARAKLPDGRNAHVTLLTRSEWVRCIKSRYRSVKEFPNENPMELILLAET